MDNLLQVLRQGTGTVDSSKEVERQSKEEDSSKDINDVDNLLQVLRQGTGTVECVLVLQNVFSISRM